MSWIKRFANVFRQDRLNREIEEELGAHIEEAIERGSSPDEARQALGRALRYREQSRDIKLLPWLDSLTSDMVFGWRQLNRRRAATAAAILSLGLAIGATTAAFRLVDAVLFRNLPVAQPGRLYYLAITNFFDRDGRPDYRDDFDYPTFRRYCETLGDKADLMVIGFSSGKDVTLGADENTEKLYRQYLSGNVFTIFGLQPTLGRLLTPNDDAVPGAHPVAVISYDFWSRQFGGDPAAVGKRFRMGPTQFEIVGVAPKGFTGTEPGTVTDVFLPASMNVEALNSPGYSWFRLWARPKPGTAPEQIRQMLQGVLSRDNAAFLKDFPNNAPKERVDALLRQSVLLFPAAAGVSDLKKDYRRPLIILSVLVCLVLLVACANIGNLLTAQAAARAREMALRVSIGAGRARLVQLLLVESALLAGAASLLGVLFSLWTAPFIVSMLAPPQRPVRLVLAVDWRTLAFSAVISLTVTFLFGLAPALRVSSLKPMSALKGAEDPYSRPRLMKSLVAAQMAFCVLVQFMAGLFISTFNRLSTRPLGFTPQRVLLLQTGVRGKNQSPAIWMQIADRLRELPGVQSATFAGWGLLTDNRWTGAVQVPGRAADPRSLYFLDVTAGFFQTMRIGWIEGRDFRAADVPPKVGEHGERVAGVAIVNEAFARAFFDGENPVGKTAELQWTNALVAPFEIVGYVHDAAYGSVREQFRPTVYVPIEPRSSGTLIVRVGTTAPATASVLRREVAQAHPGFRVNNIETQTALVERQMIRERLLSTLSMFFATLALLLAAIGLYGVLNYSVTQQRKEIGIRMALGARSILIVRRIAMSMVGVIALGAAIGLIAGLGVGRFVQTLLFDVKVTDADMVMTPIFLLLGAGILAALPPAIRAAHIDPAETLRGE